MNPEEREQLRLEILENSDKMKLADKITDHFDLEAIDMTWEDSKIIEGFMKQMKQVGFLKLINIPEFDEIELYYWTKWYYSQSEEEKAPIVRKPYNPKSPNSYRGLIPFLENDPSYK